MGSQSLTTTDAVAPPGPGLGTSRPSAPCSTAPEVVLGPMTARDLEAFIDEQVADFADERVIDGTWSRRDAQQLSRASLAKVIGWEHEAVTAERQRLWTATDAGGARVGWLWVKLGPPGPWATSAFLCQMTVARPCRHLGYGRSMLIALEGLLAVEGITDLRLNVFESNLAAKSLYATAGFLLTEQCSTMRQLCKHLDGDHPACTLASDASVVPPLDEEARVAS